KGSLMFSLPHRHKRLTTGSPPLPHAMDISLTTEVHRRGEPGSLDIHPTRHYQFFITVSLFMTTGQPLSLTFSLSLADHAMEEIVRRLTEVTTHQLKFSEQLNQRQERTEQSLEILREAMISRTPLQDHSSTAHRYLMKLGELDDVEAYIHTFEVIASERHG
ncbi:MAG: hypothetical protein ACRC9V_10975, partial [Aeromonas sp.]